MPFIQRPFPFPGPAPVDAQVSASGTWHLLRANGELTVLDPEGEPLRAVRLDPLTFAAFLPERRLILRISPDGRFAAVAEEFGLKGAVFHADSGSLAYPLERGDYYANISSFPLAFFELEGKSHLIHGTDWNRLDICDAATGTPLTVRARTEYVSGQPRPAHYLDYFHGRLHVSPGGNWIAEDGWHWHPLGATRIWSLSDWMTRNEWESEDGPSLRDLCQRAYFWDGPLVWLDHGRLAVWGLGDDDERMDPGIRIFEAATGSEIGGFPGPSISPHRIWPPETDRHGWLAYDRWLYAISPDEGTSVWDLDRGVCLHREEGFVPVGHDPRTGAFLSWSEGTIAIGHFEP